MSESTSGEKHPQFGKSRTDAVKEKIRQTNINNAIRYDKDGSILPKYLKYENSVSEYGYRIISHPLCKQKKFVTTKVHEVTDEFLQTKKSQALVHLDHLNEQLDLKNPEETSSKIRKEL